MSYDEKSFSARSSGLEFYNLPNSLIHLGMSNFVCCKAQFSKSLCLFDDSALIKQKSHKDYKDEAKFSVK